MDNLALSADGSVIAATFPKVLHYISKASKDPAIHSPASAHRISINTGHGSYFGEKYKVEKVSYGIIRVFRAGGSSDVSVRYKIFEEDGSMLGSIATSAAMHQDSLYLHGTFSLVT
jgi:hypothetical protein